MLLNKAICKQRDIEVASPTNGRGLAKDKLNTSCILVKHIVDNGDDEAPPSPFHDDGNDKEEEEEEEEDNQGADEEKTTMIRMMMIIMVMTMMMTIMRINYREYLTGVWMVMSTSSR